MTKTIFLLSMLLAPTVWAASPSPSPDDIAGYQVSGIKAGSPWDKLGLKDGDILLSVNGKPMKTQKDAEQFAEELKTGKKFSIKVRRAGKEEIIHFRAK